MWESPTALWGRLKLGREEFLQRLVTTLVCDADAPPWNTPRSPREPGRGFVGLLDEAAHGSSAGEVLPTASAVFVDEYLLPKLEEGAANGWPDRAVLWPDRVWVIELKAKAGSHRPDQLPYYLRLGGRGAPGQPARPDLPHRTPRQAASGRARRTALQPRDLGSCRAPDQAGVGIERAAGGGGIRADGRNGRDEPRPVPARRAAGDRAGPAPPEAGPSTVGDEGARARAADASVSETDVSPAAKPVVPLGLARATAADGRQRSVGAQNPEELEALGTMHWPSSADSQQTTPLDSCFPGCGARTALEATHSHPRATNSDTRSGSRATRTSR